MIEREFFRAGAEWRAYEKYSAGSIDCGDGAGIRPVWLWPGPDDRYKDDHHKDDHYKHDQYKDKHDDHRDGATSFGHDRVRDRERTITAGARVNESGYENMSVGNVSTESVILRQRPGVQPLSRRLQDIREAAAIPADQCMAAADTEGMAAAMEAAPATGKDMEDGAYQARKDISQGKPFNPNPRGSSHSDHGYNR